MLCQHLKMLRGYFEMLHQHFGCWVYIFQWFEATSSNFDSTLFWNKICNILKYWENILKCWNNIFYNLTQYLQLQTLWCLPNNVEATLNVEATFLNDV